MSATTQRVLALAFDPEVATAEDTMAARVLDAALELVAGSGFRHLTMDDVARRARVGRMTVYRRFGTRQALIEALAVRECRHCLDAIGSRLDPADPGRDGGAGAAIYAPFVRDTPVSFEELAPSGEDMARLIERTSSSYPWLVAEREQRVAGYAYATAHRSRAAYRWAADVTVYI